MPRSRQDGLMLDIYYGNNVPGQLWDTYKLDKVNTCEKNKVGLREKLENMLARSTTSAELDQLTANITPPRKSAYLKLKHKPTNRYEWLVNIETKATHGGAHFPLFLVTDNVCRRGAQAIEKRKEQYL